MKRRVKRWWGRRAFKPRTYAMSPELHAFENEVILRKVRQLEGGAPNLWVFDANALCRTYPDLFNPKFMKRTLKRMANQGLLTRSRGFTGLYTLDERPAEVERAA